MRTLRCLRSVSELAARGAVPAACLVAGLVAFTVLLSYISSGEAEL